MIQSWNSVVAYSIALVEITRETCKGFLLDYSTKVYGLYAHLNCPTLKSMCPLCVCTMYPNVIVLALFTSFYIM